MRTFFSQPYHRGSAADHSSADDRRCGTGSNIQRVKRQPCARSLGRGVAATIVFALIAVPLACSGSSADLPAAPSPVALTATAISPVAGRITGGTAVTLYGTGFRAGATVTFDGTPATDVRLITSTWITAIAPAHPAGEVDVVVANPDGRS